MTERIKGTIKVVPVANDFYSPKAFESYKRAVAKQMIKEDLLSLWKAPDSIFHYTRKENVDSILEHGLRAGIDGGVFSCTDFEELKEYLENCIVGAEYIQSLRGVMTPNTDELEDFVILEVKPVGSRNVKWYKRFDNHNILFYHGDLNVELIKEYKLGGWTDDIDTTNEHD